MPPATSKKRKGLGGGGLCLLQHYCPFCFKGKIGQSNGLCVSKGSKLVDEVQALHSARGNGLPPLDLKSPGEFCENPALCRLVCLVCGQTTVDGTDDEYGLLQEFFCEESHAITMKYEINDAMTKFGLVWTDLWDTPVHACCSKKTVCKCVVPIGTKVCPVHKRSLEPAKPAMQPTSGKRAAPPPSIVATQSSTRNVREVETGRAAWLPPPSQTTRALGTDVWSEDAARTERKRPVPPKTTPKTQKMEAAARNCKFKINTWTKANISWEGRAAALDETRTGWSLARHNAGFDPEFHGPRVVNGVRGYRRAPDGKFLPTQADVNVLNEDGTITPA